MRLFELFDQIYPIRITEKNETQWEGRFKTQDGESYMVDIWKRSNGGAEVVFSLFDDDGYWTERATGTGDAYRVFASVVEFMKEYVAEEKPSFLKFSADASEPSRVRLYKTMLGRLLPKGWTVSETRLTGAMGSNYAVFKISMETADAAE